MADDARREWVIRVLGIDPTPAQRPGPSSLQEAIQQFRDASEAVDAQIAGLQQALRGSDDEELRDIGEFGLNAVTGNFRVPLMAALMAAQQGGERGAAELGKAVAAYRNHIEADEGVEACDENPFGVAVSIRSTLVPALDQLARSL